MSHRAFAVFRQRGLSFAPGFPGKTDRDPPGNVTLSLRRPASCGQAAAGSTRREADAPGLGRFSCRERGSAPHHAAPARRKTEGSVIPPPHTFPMQESYIRKQAHGKTHAGSRAAQRPGPPAAASRATSLTMRTATGRPWASPGAGAGMEAPGKAPSATGGATGVRGPGRVRDR